jgi:hypothetical protein
MMTDKIAGSVSSGASVSKANGGSSSNFNKVLSERSKALAEDGQGGGVRSRAAVYTDSDRGAAFIAVKIGTVTAEHPTVSDLLIRNPGLKKECWNIVFATRNRDKVYTRIPDGTDIYYNPETRELLWGDMLRESDTPSAVASVPQVPVEDRDRIIQSAGAAENEPGGNNSDAVAGGLVEGLADAVKPMIGKTYAAMDCYELLVNGLGKMGIRYYGQNGLGRRMMAGALDKGLPMNAFLNGEGLIRFSGSETYRKTFNRVRDPVGQAHQVMGEMAAQLEKGSILSFSTESRGHTGIVSRRNGAWTFINSGVMDNSVERSAPRKGVGEENLAREIENWFRIAARRGESLVITLGRLSRNKLAAYGMGDGGRKA